LIIERYSISGREIYLLTAGGANRSGALWLVTIPVTPSGVPARPAPVRSVVGYDALLEFVTGRGPYRERESTLPCSVGIEREDAVTREAQTTNELEGQP